MVSAIMAKKKPGPKPGEGPARTVMTNIRSTESWRGWLDRFAAFRRLTVADVIDQSVVAHARETGFSEEAPKR